MTEFYMVVNDNYVVGFGTNGSDDVDAITEDDYNALSERIQMRPTAPSGYAYRLRADDLEWELVELPPVPDPGEEDATAEDYEAALSDLGVKL